MSDHMTTHDDARSSSGHCRHACRCTRPPAETAATGLMLRSLAPTVDANLRDVFGEAQDEDGAVVVPLDRLPELRALLTAMSLIERSSIRAVIVDATGTHDPWSAGAVESVLVRLETDWLPSLLRERRLRFDFQPIVDASSGAVDGNEALVRPVVTGHDVTPFDLFRAARAHDATLTTDQVCRTIAIRDGAPAVHAGTRLFVNFMPLTIYDPSICLRTTFAAADAAGVPLDRLVFEVVESEDFPDIAHLRSILEAYRDQGASVALDDVGAGNTAVRYIDELRPDIVKLDGDLLRTAVDTGEDALYAGLVEHCHRLGIRVIGEGVEMPGDVAFCRNLGVELLQGFGIARPAAQPVSGTIAFDGDEADDPREAGDRRAA